MVVTVVRGFFAYSPSRPEERNGGRKLQSILVFLGTTAQDVEQYPEGWALRNREAMSKPRHCIPLHVQEITRRAASKHSRRLV